MGNKAESFINEQVFAQSERTATVILVGLLAINTISATKRFVDNLKS